MQIGQGVAQSNGSWSITSNVLASGTYKITATGNRSVRRDDDRCAGYDRADRWLSTPLRP